MAQRSLTSLQAGRGLAAFAVLLFHANQTLSLPKYFGREPAPLFRWGNSGVQFFFVLSGFVILLAHTPDIGHPRTLPSFLWKRFRRLYPMLWIVLLLVLAAFLLHPALGTGVQQRVPSIVSAFAIAPGSHELLLAPEWTLRHEVLFYGVFSLLLINRMLGLAAITVWLLPSLWLVITGRLTSEPSLINPNHLLFAMGMVACMIFQRHLLRRGGAVAAVILGAAAFILACLLRNGHSPFVPDHYDQLFGVSSALLIVGLVVLERQGRLSSARWLIFLGEASYAIYLIHDPIVSAMAKVTSNPQRHLLPQVAFALTCSAALAGGILFHIACERPLLRLLSSRKERPGQIAVHAPALASGAPLAQAHKMDS